MPEGTNKKNNQEKEKSFQNSIEISHSDNFFSETEQSIIENYCLAAKYGYGERDDEGKPPTGMIHNIPETEFIYKLFKKKIYERAEFVQDMKLYRMYVNHYSPSEQANFHVDGYDKGELTFLYYPIMKEYDLDEGGETQFLLNDNIFGIRAISNRMVVFDATIPHRATPFRNNHRFTVAIKYEK